MTWSLTWRWWGPKMGFGPKKYCRVREKWWYMQGRWPKMHLKHDLCDWENKWNPSTEINTSCNVPACNSWIFRLKVNLKMLLHIQNVYSILWLIFDEIVYLHLFFLGVLSLYKSCLSYCNALNRWISISTLTIFLLLWIKEESNLMLHLYIVSFLVFV